MASASTTKRSGRSRTRDRVWDVTVTSHGHQATIEVVARRLSDACTEAIAEYRRIHRTPKGRSVLVTDCVPDTTDDPSAA